MSTLADRHVVVCDGAAALIVAAWLPAEPNKVVREEFQEGAFPEIEGRRVFVFAPEDGASSERINRGELVLKFKVKVVVFEVYREPGPLTKTWMAARRQFVDAVYTALDKIAEGDRLLSTLWTETLEITNSADADAVEQHKEYFAELDAEFHEIVSG